MPATARTPDAQGPAWLDAPATSGAFCDMSIRARGLRADVAARIWSPAGSGGQALPLLVAHDGPDYEAKGALTRYAGALIAAERLPPFRIALLAAADRDEWYSASAAYARALATDVVVSLRATVPVAGRPVGIGASLGALALLHCHHRWPGTFGGLFLQSGSFFVPRFDRHESGFSRYGRIVRFVREVARAAAPADPAPLVLTCGTAEENLHNNRQMAAALAERGACVRLHEIDGGHDFEGWRAALDPHLTALLAGRRRS